MVYLEAAWNAVRARGDRTRGVIAIDLAGAGLGMLGYMATVKRIATAGVLMYPEINERVTIVNAGWFISTLWSAIKPFLPKRTEGKIRIVNTDYQDIIYPEIIGGAASLPLFLGGGLGEREHRVCPAQAVDTAYGAIAADICGGAAEYPDQEQFLQAALQHAHRHSLLSSDSTLHRDRATMIENYIEKNRER
jgi:hypothetical protein